MDILLKTTSYTVTDTLSLSDTPVTDTFKIDTPFMDISYTVTDTLSLSDTSVTDTFKIDTPLMDISFTDTPSRTHFRDTLSMETLLKTTLYTVRVTLVMYSLGVSDAWFGLYLHGAA